MMNSLNLFNSGVHFGSQCLCQPWWMAPWWSLVEILSQFPILIASHCNEIYKCTQDVAIITQWSWIRIIILDQDRRHSNGHQGAISIYRCILTSIGIPIIKIKQSHDHLIFIMEIFIPGKTVLILRQGPDILSFLRSLVKAYKRRYVPSRF